MAWGAGTFTEGVYNKIIPGSYINIKVTSVGTGSVSDRGYLAAPVELPWGPDGEIMTVTNQEYLNNCYNIFGYTLGSKELVFIDEMFKNASVLYLYRLNGEGTKAKGTTGTAKYSGSFGNKISVVVAQSDDDENFLDVITYVDGVESDRQSVNKEKTQEVKVTKGEETPGETVETATVAFEAGKDFIKATISNKPEGYDVRYTVKSSSDVVVAETPGKLWVDNEGDVYTLHFTPEAGAQNLKFEIALIKQQKGAKKQVIGTVGVTATLEESPDPVVDVDQLKDNAFVIFDRKNPIKETGGDVFTGGTDGRSNAAAHEKARALFETVFFNVLAVPTTDQEIQDAYIKYVKTQREEFGVKFQIVLPYIKRANPLNYEGIIEYINTVKDPIKDAATDLCYWIAGAEAGCPVQSSCTAKAYDGYFQISAQATRLDMTKALKNGQLLFHKAGDDAVILRDINTLTRIEKGQENSKSLDFSMNQVVRVLDGITTETANIFNSLFLGKRNNTDLERVELKNQLVAIRERYAQIGAIETYDSASMIINPGMKPNEVIGYDAIKPLQAMDTLYFTIQYINE